MSLPRRIGIAESLRNTRRYMGDGTLGGRVRSATPRSLQRTATPGGDRAAPLTIQQCVDGAFGEDPGFTYGTDFVVPVSEGRRNGSAVLLADSRVLYAWTDGGAIRLGQAPSLEIFVSENNSISESEAFEEGLNSPAASVYRLPDGRLQLHVAWHERDGDQVARVRWYISNNEGLSWALTDERSKAWSSSTIRGRWEVGVPLLSDGRLILPSTVPQTDSFSEVGGMFAVYTSDDGGESWALRLETGAHISNLQGVSHGRTIEAFDGSLWATFGASTDTGRWRVYRSFDNGGTWALAFDVEAGGPFPSRTTLFRDPAASELRAIGFPFSNPGRLLRSTNPALFAEWTVEDDEGDPEWGPHPGFGNRNDIRPLLQEVGGSLLLFWFGRITLVGSSPQPPYNSWRGILFSGQDEETFWCLRVDNDGRVRTSERVSGIRHRRFAFIDEVIGGGGSVFLDDLSDVTVPAPTIGDGIAWNGSAWVAEAPTTIDLSDDPPERIGVEDPGVSEEASRSDHGHEGGLDDLDDVDLLSEPVADAEVALVEDPASPGSFVRGSVASAGAEIVYANEPPAEPSEGVVWISKAGTFIDRDGEPLGG